MHQVEPSQHKPDKKKIVKECDAGTRNSNPSTNNSLIEEKSDDKPTDRQWVINRMINRPERMIHAEAHCTMDPIGMLDSLKTNRDEGDDEEVGNVEEAKTEETIVEEGDDTDWHCV